MPLKCRCRCGGAGERCKPAAVAGGRCGLCSGLGATRVAGGRADDDVNGPCHKSPLPGAARVPGNAWISNVFFIFSESIQMNVRPPRSANRRTGATVARGLRYLIGSDPHVHQGTVVEIRIHRHVYRHARKHDSTHRVVQKCLFFAGFCHARRA